MNYMNRSDFDIEKTNKWECPDGTGVPLITMPNIPRPLHGRGMQPRTVFGQRTWDFMRKKAYFNAGYKCEICGREPDKRGDLHAHELFSYDYDRTSGEFNRVIAICRTCHDGIHSGRLITMFKSHHQMYPKSYVLKVVENCFKLVSEYNKENNANLRVYDTYLEYLKVDELKDDMVELIKKYDIKFYTTKDSARSKVWKGWRVKIGSAWYNSPYSCQADWEAAMEEMAKHDNVRQSLNDPFKSKQMDEIDKILSEN